MKENILDKEEEKYRLQYNVPEEQWRLDRIRKLLTSIKWSWIKQQWTKNYKVPLWKQGKIKQVH